jgi:Immunoglobulin-like domain of bacterial spore germination
MLRGRLLVLATIAAVLVPSAADARASLTATGIRIGEHPAFVRVVVDFSGGRLVAGTTIAGDPDPLDDGTVSITVRGRNARARAPRARGAGLRARVRQGRNRLVLGVSAAPRRFKYAGYQVFHNGERLVVDLYKSAPPSSGAFARFGRPGCLAVGKVAVRSGKLTATGSERDVFEHSFPVRVWSARGLPLGQRVVQAARGRWRATVRYLIKRRQTGIVEAVELSAKDGALACLAQRPVALRP